ncbi:1-phosphatidylinositol 4,5-bisphosphate phosphodiesterase delta-1-like isoform X2 [Protopterus annectens]|uniref:1-phosphatidylinositol 4,5-bisphosphate phosphodiesterase delta-1-like isoform X2 n=1 Tax=Protopterus annectens TaxID=7888 RepID=UPI001CFBD76B|nr:1-phosphatidylinositol 4,5-bisphosphate phosphodiesterase delta-1-like isoform X2 [Protopterus annectens]
MDLNDNVYKSLHQDADLQHLLKGSKMCKIKSSKWKKQRLYKLQDDCKTVWHESSKILKSPDSQTFSIEDIEDVRGGHQTEKFQKCAKEFPENQCFSIIFKGKKHNLDLVANSEKEAVHWISGMKKIMNSSNSMNQKEKLEYWIYSCFRKADKNKDNKMSLEEVKEFFKLVNIEVNDLYAKKLFEKCDKSKSNTLEDIEIAEFYKLLTEREEIDVIFGQFSDKKLHMMTVSDLHRFIVEEQRQEEDEEYAAALIEKYELNEFAKKEKHMTKDGFLMYLLSPECDLFNPAHKEVYMDMNQPLSHYYISSSHNTYLMEDQLKGPSSTEAYIRALGKGCRCVEMDCWDGPNGEPIIYHGYTLTSKILFKDVIQVIKDHAFKVSPYPVILSMENHCSLEQQKVLAKHLKNILGDMLLTIPVNGNLSELPSPEQLKGKILVKGKKKGKLENHIINNNVGDVQEEIYDVSDEDEAAEIDDEAVRNKVQNSKKSKNVALAKALSDIVIYCKSVHFQGFKQLVEQLAFYEMSSFSETKAFKLVEESAPGFILHNTRQLSRTYPAGLRTDSSNYNPISLWNVGCQIVALNFQTSGAEMDLYQGKFQDNGHAGYVLKPSFLRERNSSFDPRSVSKGKWMRPKTLHVMVISAQQLPKVNSKKNSILDPLVVVEVHGVTRDCDKRSTEHVTNNGFNPQWNERFQFGIDVPELALLRFVVLDHDSSSRNDFVGQYTVPFTSTRKGYHHIHLLNKQGHRIPSATLFVHIMIVDQ